MTWFSSPGAVVWRDRLILVLFCLAVYLPGLGAVPPLDRDESRFAQASKQMLESGNFVDIRFQETPRHKKPAGAYWLQALSSAVFDAQTHASIWPYRLPSVLGALAAVLMTHATALVLFNRRVALIAGLFLGGSVLLAAEAHQAKTDALLLATICAMQWALAVLYRRPTDTDEDPPGFVFWLFWGGLGLSILIKGPVGVMVVGLTVAALAIADRRVAWLAGLRPLPGLILALLIAVPWFVAVMLVTDGAFLATAVGQDLAPKLFSGQESHDAPPGYYAALMAVTLWPASLFVWPAVFGAWQERRRPALRFLIAWVVPSWIVFEIVPTKLPHYVLPTYPALAILGAAAAVALIDRQTFAPARTLAHRYVRYFGIFWAVVAILLAAAAIVLPILFGAGVTPVIVLGALVLAGAGGTAAWLRWHGFHGLPVALALLAGLVAVPMVFGVVMPRLDDVWVSRTLAQQLRTLDPDRYRDVAVAGYGEPSLVFLAGTDIRIGPASQVADYVNAHRHALAVVEARVATDFKNAMATHDLPLKAIGTVQGINYSKGKAVNLTIYEVPLKP